MKKLHQLESYPYCLRNGRRSIAAVAVTGFRFRQDAEKQEFAGSYLGKSWPAHLFGKVFISIPKNDKQ